MSWVRLSDYDQKRGAFGRPTEMLASPDSAKLDDAERILRGIAPYIDQISRAITVSSSGSLLMAALLGGVIGYFLGHAVK